MRLSGLPHPLLGHPAMASNDPHNRRVRLLRLLALGFLCLCAAMWAARAAAQEQTPTSGEQESQHETEQWRQIQSHLPDRATATSAELEQEADILRARRFPEDALVFYNDAIARGGDVPALLNKLGLTELELRNIELARSYFMRAVKLSRRNASSWNNLGAVEYLDKSAQAAASDYKRAIKLDKRQAVFHANLATAYFGTRDYGGARREMAAAMKLDPRIFERAESTGGVEAHVLTSQDRARFAYEMAKLYARAGQQEQMLHSLAMACEAGMDVQREMRHDVALAQFENDPRVVLLVHNAEIVRATRSATVSAQSNGSAAAPPTGSRPMME
jgi:tetratricopeptide (TPR) repeat protein